VVENAEEITVRFSDKRELIAKVIGADTRSDVAVIKVEATACRWSRSADTKQAARGRMGDRRSARPFGFSNTVTAGIVSATWPREPLGRSRTSTPCPSSRPTSR
jgi:serine protease Do